MIVGPPEWRPRQAAPDPDPAPAPAGNGLLVARPAGEYAALLPHLRAAHLDDGATPYAPCAPIRTVYFPLADTAAVVATTADGALVEVGTVGREGHIGVVAFHGADGGPPETLVQVPGDCLRLPVAVPCAAAVVLSR